MLYITYDGILEPLGNSQVYSYIDELKNTYNITIISFEKKKDLENDQYFLNKKKDFKNKNINWIPLKYHSRPKLLSSFYDILIIMVELCHLINLSNV